MAAQGGRRLLPPVAQRFGVAWPLPREGAYPAHVLRAGTPEAGPNAPLNTTPQKWATACRFGGCRCFELAHSGFGVE